MPAAGTLQSPGERTAAADHGPIGIESFAQEPQVLQRRRLGHEFAFHQQFVDPPASRRQLLQLVSGFFGEPPPVVVERQEGVPMRGDLLDLAGGEVGGQASMLERLPPPSPGSGTLLSGPGQSPFGLGYPVSEHVNRALASRERLEPIDLRLGRREPSFQAQCGVNTQPGVEGGDLGRQFDAAGPGSLTLSAGRFEACGGIAIE